MCYLLKTKVLFVLTITASIPILQFQHLIDKVFHNWQQVFYSPTRPQSLHRKTNFQHNLNFTFIALCSEEACLLLLIQCILCPVVKTKSEIFLTDFTKQVTHQPSQSRPSRPWTLVPFPITIFKMSLLLFHYFQSRCQNPKFEI